MTKPQLINVLRLIEKRKSNTQIRQYVREKRVIP